MMTARNFYRYIGGNATNVAVGLARLGLAAAVISKVGADIHGEYLLAGLRSEGVDCSFVAVDPEQPTAQCYMTRQADGSPDYYAWPSPNASKTLVPQDIKPESFSDSWIWHVAAVSFIAKPRRFAMTHAIEEAGRRDKIISFDACFPLVQSDGGRKAAGAAMLHADILRFNLAEAAYWSNMPFDSDPELMVQSLLKQFSPALLIVTLAERGSLLYCRGEKAFCPPFVVESIGDVGPGDAFSAGLIYGLATLGQSGMERRSIRNLDIGVWAELARYGACTGAMVTRAYSATEKFPELTELKQAMGETSPQT